MDFVLGFAVALIVTSLTGAVVLERARRHDLAARVAEQAETIRELTRRLDALARVDENHLYRDSLEDQRARQLAAASDVATGVEFMVQAIRRLNPELLKKGKKP